MKVLCTGLVFLCAAGVAFGADAPEGARPAVAPGGAYVHWLQERSMLHQSQLLARRYSGDSLQWRQPYGQPQPHAAVARASVWFTAYPASTIAAAPGASVLATLADERLWRAFQAIGIQGIHTGPMKRSGGVRGYSYTPSIDGNFDRISFDIDPDFGTLAQYRTLVRAARAHGAVVIGDVIPGHTGKGPDFRLAERGYADYPGIYHMVLIKPVDWGLLPAVPAGHDAVNLSPDTVDALQRKGYIVGQLHSGIFYEPAVKETDWSATDAVLGVDGVRRRWVYLHYFKQGQPTLNWLDPSFAAERLVIGDAVHELGVLGDSMLRLDANGLLGIERESNGHVWWAGHPLSLTANQLIADMVRKLDGFTFEELALPLDVMREMSRGGPDLSYDFVTRPAYDHALLTGDAGFLRLVFQLMRKYDIDPGRLIHALQNHDELTMGISHFAAHADETFAFRGGQLRGDELRELVRREMYQRLIGERAPYNLKFNEGVASTTATIAAAALGLRGLTALGPAEVQRIKQLHLLLAFYNAMQPGVFALSGWDLVGALTLPAASVRERLADGDTRWINRGAYDLLGTNPTAKQSAAGLPRAGALYGSVPEQLRSPDSFAARLARLLKARAELHLAAARLSDVPEVHAPGLLVLVHELPDNAGHEITAINFGEHAVDESVAIPGLTGRATDVLDPQGPTQDVSQDGLRLQLEGY
ncbi:MAG TPA: maltose alpha-D-glucosyltransferase, partial [Candidatus Dormibacteraeota bacterium]|nr:maltose alpha-D-glucosyltransferase [Candidatus Dormibacteraeota bacterium]